MDDVEWVSVSAHMHVHTVWVKSDKQFVQVVSDNNHKPLIQISLSVPSLRLLGGQANSSLESFSFPDADHRRRSYVSALNIPSLEHGEIVKKMLKLLLK